MFKVKNLHSWVFLTYIIIYYSLYHCGLDELVKLNHIYLPLTGVINIVIGMFLYCMAISAILGILLWLKSPLAKRWIKFTIYITYSFAITLLIPIWIFRPRDSRNALLPAAGYRGLCKILELKYFVEGEKNIVRNSGSVVLINHQSILDIIVLAYLYPLLPKCTVIAKKEILYYQPIGLAYWLAGAIFIDRTKPSAAQTVVKKTGEFIRKRKAAVIMCPEGTRNDGPTLLPFKKGAFHLAVASQCPIQPVAVSRFTFLGPNKFESGEIKIRILPPIPTEGCTGEDVGRLTEEAYRVMSENVDEISKVKSNNSESI